MDRLCFAVLAVRVVGVTQLVACRVFEVFERLFFVDADNAPGRICDEVPAVAVIVPQQPVSDGFPLKLFCRPCRKLTAVVLPLFEVRTAGRVNALLECAEFPVKRPRPHWNGTVRVYDTLHLIPGFLRVGSEHLRLSALALGGFE